MLWNFFAQATSWSTACFLSYAPLIRKIYVPRSIFVLATVLAGIVNLLISLVPLALIMLVIGHPFSRRARVSARPDRAHDAVRARHLAGPRAAVRDVRGHRPDLPGRADGLDVSHADHVSADGPAGAVPSDSWCSTR